MGIEDPNELKFQPVQVQFHAYIPCTNLHRFPRHGPMLWRQSLIYLSTSYTYLSAYEGEEYITNRLEAVLGRVQLNGYLEKPPLSTRSHGSNIAGNDPFDGNTRNSRSEIIMSGQFKLWVVVVGGSPGGCGLCTADSGASLT